jgi:inhibitor of cysteine peptidase
MSNKVIGLFILSLVAVLLSSCSPKVVNYELTSADNGTQIEIPQGAKLSVTLEGNPSTGYSWEAEALDANLFEQSGDPVFNTSNPGLVGSGGTLTLTFKTLDTGTGTLMLVYHRP